MATESIQPKIEPVHPSRQLYTALQINPNIDSALAGSVSSFGEERITYHPLRRAYTNAGYEGDSPDALSILRGRATVRGENFQNYFGRAVALASSEKLEYPHFTSGYGQTFPDFSDLSRQVQYSSSATFYGYQQTQGNGYQLDGSPFAQNLSRSVSDLYQAGSKLGPGVPSLRSNFDLAA
ncbi:hypothetical protein [Magnetococcus sp. PR-3]|uniref:hypothetical protein n=1 Tax=Magnetococcus sp. PR-3 TaxID=3120355 RepID=UPI002FCE0C15